MRYTAIALSPESPPGKRARKCSGPRKQFRQHGLHARQVNEFRPHFGKFPITHFSRFATVSTVGQPEQACHVVQAEAQALCRFHESHPRDICLAVAANAAVRLVWFGQQTLALVEPDGLYVDIGGPGEATDRQVCQIVFHTA